MLPPTQGELNTTGESRESLQEAGLRAFHYIKSGDTEEKLREDFGRLFGPAFNLPTVEFDFLM